jgi:hypothetical protein
LVSAHLPCQSIGAAQLSARPFGAGFDAGVCQVAFSREKEETSMAKQPEFRKYLPLEEWFRKQPATPEQIELTFDQVEAILGTPLPRSATKLATWWTNVQPKIQSHRTAWLNNGWMVAEFDQQAMRVKFVRGRP